jgi:periplasmic protein TonB
MLLAGGVVVAQTPEKPSDNKTGQSPEPVYHVGTDGVTAPRVIRMVHPEYSEKARRAKLQGTVVLTLVVSSSGNPTMIRVTQSLGHGLDEKAIEALGQWKFEPGSKDEKPVAVEMAVQIDFRLYK